MQIIPNLAGKIAGELSRPPYRGSKTLLGAEVLGLIHIPGKHRKVQFFLGNWIAGFKGPKLMVKLTATCCPGRVFFFKAERLLQRWVGQLGLQIGSHPAHFAIFWVIGCNKTGIERLTWPPYSPEKTL